MDGDDKFPVLCAGGDHQAKAGQGPQEDPGEESQVPPGGQGEGQVQGGDNREDARVDGFLIDTIKKTDKIQPVVCLLSKNLMCPARRLKILYCVLAL